MKSSLNYRWLLVSLVASFSVGTQAYAGTTPSPKKESVKINSKSVYDSATALSVDLFNTGVNGSGKVSNGSAADPNFKVNINGEIDGKSKNLKFDPSYVATKSIDNKDHKVADAHPYWLDDNQTSAWVTPYQDGLKSLDPTSNGTYIYQETFTLSGLDSFEKLSLSGRWAADNYGVMKLNGTIISTISVTGSSDHSSFNSWHSFSIPYTMSNLFLNGTNTFTWEITNIAQKTGNPTGLRVEFFSFNVKNVSPVPENDTYAMLLAGLGLVGFTVRRRKI